MAKRKELPWIIDEPYDPNRLRIDQVYAILKELPRPMLRGRNHVELTTEGIEILKTGKYVLWFTDGEYAHEIHLKEEEE